MLRYELQVSVPMNKIATEYNNTLQTRGGPQESAPTIFSPYPIGCLFFIDRDPLLFTSVQDCKLMHLSKVFVSLL